MRLGVCSTHCFRRCFSRLAAQPPQATTSAASPEDRIIRLAREKKDALLIAVVDATDFEGTCLPRAALRSILGAKRPVLLAVSKVDRLPRLLDTELRYLRHRFESRGPHCIGAHAVSARTGLGLAQLASQALQVAAHEDIIVFGAKDTGKSELVLALVDAMQQGSFEAAAGLPPGNDGRTFAPTLGVTPVHCFADSPTRALWDTPGCTAGYVLPAQLPAALATPLTDARALSRPIRTRPPLHVRAGESVLLELRVPRTKLDTTAILSSIETDALPVACIDVIEVGNRSGAIKGAGKGGANKGGASSAGIQAASESELGALEPTKDHEKANKSPARVQVAAYLPDAIEVRVVPTAEVPRAMIEAPNGMVGPGLVEPVHGRLPALTLQEEAGEAEADLNAQLFGAELDAEVGSDVPRRQARRQAQRQASRQASGQETVVSAAVISEGAKAEAAMMLPFHLYKFGHWENEKLGTKAREGAKSREGKEGKEGKKGAAAGRRDYVLADHWRDLRGHGIDMAFAGLGHLGLYHSAAFKLQARGPAKAACVARKPLFSRQQQDFMPHWKPEEIEAGLASGELVRGRLSQRFPGVARVSCGEGSLARIVIRGRSALNRALDGDTVVVRLWPRRSWLPIAPQELESLSGAVEALVGDAIDGISAEVTSLGPPMLGKGMSTAVEEAVEEAAATLAVAGAGTHLDDTGSAALCDRLKQRLGHVHGEGLAEAVAASTVAPSAAAEGLTLQAIGEVVGILERNTRPFVAVLSTHAKRSRSSQPADRALLAARRSVMPLARVADNGAEGGLLADTLYAVQISSWKWFERFPTAVVAQTLGPVGEPAAEGKAILVDHAVNTSPFTADARASLPTAGWAPSDEEVGSRLDFREGLAGEAICSVDPPGSIDIDDALHAVELPRAVDGSRRFQVGVHIADMAHFVKAGEALDAEAAVRGTTFYLVDQRVNMVPELLGENVASLHPAVDRLAFSLLFEMDEHANVLTSHLAKTLVRSRAALSYAEAQRRIDNCRAGVEASCGAGGGGMGLPHAAVAAADLASSIDATADPVTKSLCTLNALARQMSARRTEAGAMRLATPEVKFAIEGSGGSPSDMITYTPLETNSMVEEFMLLANTTAAKIILESFPRTALLRRHPVPRKSSFGFLSSALMPHGIELDLSSPKALATSLDACDKADEPYFNTLARYMAVRAMPPAEYVVAGKVEEDGGSYAHFGLGSPVYAHFTSPIRRYADQIVHRMAAVAIGCAPATPELMDVEAMSELADALNERHLAAKEVGRASVSLYSLIYFRNQPSEEIGYAMRVSPKGLSVLIPRYGIESWVPIDHGPNSTSPFKWDHDAQTLVARGHTLRSLDRVNVRISVDTSRLHPRLAVQLLDANGQPFVETLRSRRQAALIDSKATAAPAA